MLKVGITGQKGFIGQHLYNYLNLQDDIELMDFDRSYFKQTQLLAEWVVKCDTIVHLAAMNRHDDPQVIYDTNVDLTKKIIDACIESDVQPHILLSSSTQESRDNKYGQSKKKCREMIEEWGERCEAATTGMIIPNVFGPFGKPFYNSVVATFCYQLANNEEPEIIQDGTVNLIYINELTVDVYKLIVSREIGTVNLKYRHSLKVSELKNKLLKYKVDYMDFGKFPNLDSEIDLALFNTFRCYLPVDYYPKKFVQHKDDRGKFVEIVRADTSGQFSYSTTVPGVTRGNHFHTRKAERFSVIKGAARIQLRKIGSSEVINYDLDGSEPSYVDMPIWHTHNITNIGTEELITLFWINEPYNQEDPDTYFINV